MTERTYVYPATEVVKITDGDTYWLQLDVGFRQTQLAHLRLNGWDTPELRHGSEYEKEQGSKAKAVAEAFIVDGVVTSTLWVRTYKDPDSFGRWLADLWREDKRLIYPDLGEWLATNQLATQWPTRWRDEYDL